MHKYFDDSTLKFSEEFTERGKTESREKEAQEKHTTTPLTPRQMEGGRKRAE